MLLVARSRPRGRPGPRRPARRDERGTAVVGTLVGFAIFMAFLLLAVQVLVRLYATSVLTSAAFAAAHAVATAPDPAAEVDAAQRSAIQQLGSFGAAHTTFTWQEVGGQQIVLHVRAEAPGFVPVAGLRTIERTVTVRTERVR